MTPAPVRCRLLQDAPGSGAWNMAIDEVLLNSAIEHGTLTLRFYRWSEATLSLGYFQRYSDRALHAGSQNCPIVRRSSGGGAIVHDQELTYSLAVPPGSTLTRNAIALYDAAHESLISALASWGLRPRKVEGQETGRCDADLRQTATRGEPFLCFQRRACGDVLLADAKVCGSAQRRHRGAILQHGSVLLERSAAAKELPGLRELSTVTMHENELYLAWFPRFADLLGVRAVPSELTPAELAEARHITVAKHSAEAWLKKR